MRPASLERLPLAQALRTYSEEDAEPPPPQLLKKYIAYARAHVHPQLSDEAKQVRQASGFAHTVPCRQLDWGLLGPCALKCMMRSGRSRAYRKDGIAWHGVAAMTATLLGSTASHQNDKTCACAQFTRLVCAMCRF